MVAGRNREYVTRQEYLAWERKATTKSEYHDGVVVAMAGASRQHNRITLDTARSLGNQLEGAPCEPFSSDMRVLVPERNRYFYPDIVVVCGDAQFEDAELATLENPTLIIEVLSESTEHADRRLKSDCYRTLPSLRAYVLIAQDEPRIETFTRQDDGGWRHEAVRGREAMMSMPVWSLRLRLMQTYQRRRARTQKQQPDKSLSNWKPLRPQDACAFLMGKEIN